MLDKVSKMQIGQKEQDDDDDDWGTETDPPISAEIARPSAGLRMPISAPPLKGSRPPPKASDVASFAAPAPKGDPATPAQSNSVAAPEAKAAEAGVATSATAAPEAPKPVGGFRLPMPPPEQQVAGAEANHGPRPPSAKAPPSLSVSAASSSSTPSSSAAAAATAPSSSSSSSTSAAAAVSAAYSSYGGGGAASQAQRIRELEAEVESLTSRLIRMRSRVEEERPGAKSNKQLQRELETERDLDAAILRNSTLLREKRTLETSVNLLHAQLTEVGTAKVIGADTTYAHTARITTQSKVDNDKLKKLLEKTKEEKDKAIRALIHVIGKEKVADFLQKNAGAPNILDELLKRFSNIGKANADPVDVVQGGSSSPTRLSPGKQKSRMM